MAIPDSLCSNAKLYPIVLPCGSASAFLPDHRRAGRAPHRIKETVSYILRTRADDIAITNRGVANCVKLGNQCGGALPRQLRPCSWEPFVIGQARHCSIQIAGESGSFHSHMSWRFCCSSQFRTHTWIHTSRGTVGPGQQ